MDKIFFREEQPFRQWWLWVLLAGVTLVFVYGVIQQLILKIPFGDNPAPDWILLVSGLIPVSMMILFYNTKLVTEVRNDGIYYKFAPYQWKFKRIAWDEIEKAEVRKYRPIPEFGGWGFRHSTLGKGRAVNVSGNVGLQLIFKNGKKLLIGTQKEYELIKALDRANENM